MFNSDGEVWKAVRVINPHTTIAHYHFCLQHRTMARPFFSKERVTDLEIIGKQADLAIDILCKASEPLDIQDLVARFTMDAAFGFMFGRESHTLKATFLVPVTLSSGSVGPRRMTSTAFSSKRSTKCRCCSTSDLLPTRYGWLRSSSPTR